MSSTHRALFVDKPDGTYRARLIDRADSEVGVALGLDGTVDIDVSHSTLNYKDALAITGASPVLRTLPLVPGIDLAGTVTASRDPRFVVGDRVLVDGYGIGESVDGGLTQKARVKADWLVKIPAPYSAFEAMAVGTAGFTAALSVLAIEGQGITPAHGDVVDVLVTGASGGVGSIATLLLVARGFRVIASTGKASEHGYLRGLGASEVIDRGTLSSPAKPLGKERWAAAVDSVGSHTLANVVSQTKRAGVVAACGLAQGMDFPSSVAPFILRGVALLGIDSVEAPMAKRLAAWSLLAQHVDPQRLASITQTIGLADAIEVAPKFLRGEVKGRIVVDCAR